MWLRVASKTMHKRQDGLSLPNRAIGEGFCGLFGWKNSEVVRGGDALAVWPWTSRKQG